MSDSFCYLLVSSFVHCLKVVLITILSHLLFKLNICNKATFFIESFLDNTKTGVHEDLIVKCCKFVDKMHHALTVRELYSHSRSLKTLTIMLRKIKSTSKIVLKQHLNFGKLQMHFLKAERMQDNMY